MRTEFIDPGEFRQECALEEPAEMPDGAGGAVVTWNEVATLFVRIEPLRAASRFGADQVIETVTHSATLRHRNGLRSGMRLTRLGRVFDILTVHDADETGRYLVCTLREEGR